MMQVRTDLTPAHLKKKVSRLFDLSAEKLDALDRSWNPSKGAPVFTVGGKYTSRGWTEMDAGIPVRLGAFCSSTPPARREFLELGRDAHAWTLMAPHVTHIGVHDHGFNNVSTYGNLLRLMNEGRIAENAWERQLLRAGAEGVRRGAGRALDAHRRRRRLHLFVQRPALAVRRHDPLAARAGGRRTSSATC